MSFGRVEIFASSEPRLRWSRAEMGRWVLALMAPGESSTGAAREARVYRAQLYR